MATETESVSVKYRIHHDGEWHDLIIVMRDSHPQVAAPLMAKLAQTTLGVWLKAWRAVKRDTWRIESPIIPEVKHEIPARLDGEPRVTIHNHTFETGKFSMTIHSHADGTGAIEMYGAQLALFDEISATMPRLFNPHDNETHTPPVKQQAPEKRDINDVDKMLGTQPPTPKEAPKPSPVKQGNVYVRQAKSGSIAGLIQLEKGKKDKPTWSMAIVASKPYSYKAPEYQDKEIICYPITGALTLREWQDGGRSFEIPTINSKINIKELGETILKDGTKIPSEWQNLIQHLGLKDQTLPTGFSIEVPATHVAMQAGAVLKDKQGADVQYKKYSGLYLLPE